METEEKGHTYIFSFAEDGFEAIIDLTAMDMAYIQAKMADTKMPQTVGSLVHAMELRARFNGERKLEVWVLGVEPGITEEDLWEWARQNPQSLADALRDRGHNIYGKHYHKAGRVIS